MNEKGKDNSNLGKRLASRTGERFKTTIQKTSRRKIIFLAVALIIILLVTNPNLLFFLPTDIKDKMNTQISSLLGDAANGLYSVTAFSWITLLKLVVMILILSILFEIARMMLNMMAPTTSRGTTLLHLTRSAVTYLFVLIGIFWGLSLLGVNLSALFASVGIVALVIGFGAESLIEDQITGLFMLFENEFNVGDIIELDGYRGTVTEIGIRTTHVMDAGGNIKIINNSDMRNLINLSDKASRAICDFPIPYEVKIADAEKALDKVLENTWKKYPEIFPQKPVYLGVQELAGSAVVLRVIAEVKEADRFTAARLLNRELKSGMEELGISCPFTQVVVHQAEEGKGSSTAVVLESGKDHE